MAGGTALMEGELCRGLRRVCSGIDELRAELRAEHAELAERVTTSELALRMEELKEWVRSWVEQASASQPGDHMGAHEQVSVVAQLSKLSAVVELHTIELDNLKAAICSKAIVEEKAGIPALACKAQAAQLGKLEVDSSDIVGRVERLDRRHEHKPDLDVMNGILAGLQPLVAIEERLKHTHFALEQNAASQVEAVKLSLTHVSRQLSEVFQAVSKKVSTAQLEDIHEVIEERACQLEAVKLSLYQICQQMNEVLRAMSFKVSEAQLQELHAAIERRAARSQLDLERDAVARADVLRDALDVKAAKLAAEIAKQRATTDMLSVQCNVVQHSAEQRTASVLADHRTAIAELEAKLDNKVDKQYFANRMDECTVALKKKASKAEVIRQSEKASAARPGQADAGVIQTLLLKSAPVYMARLANLAITECYNPFGYVLGVVCTPEGIIMSFNDHQANFIPFVQVVEHAEVAEPRSLVVRPVGPTQLIYAVGSTNETAAVDGPAAATAATNAGICYGDLTVAILVWKLT